MCVWSGARSWHRGGRRSHRTLTPSRCVAGGSRQVAGRARRVERGGGRGFRGGVSAHVHAPPMAGETREPVTLFRCIERWRATAQCTDAEGRESGATEIQDPSTASRVSKCYSEPFH